MLNELIQFVKDNPRLILGNAVGLVSAVFCFLSYQAKTPKKLLMLQCCATVATIISYAILGAWSGMALNVVCLFRNFTYTERAKRVSLFASKAWGTIMAVILGCIGALSWQGPISLFVIIPLMINTVILSLGDNRKLRISILFTSTLVIVYNLFFRSYFSVLMEATAIVSSVIGLIRYRGQEEE